MRNEYQRLMDQVEPEKDLIERTERAVRAAQTPRRPRHTARRIAVLAAVLCLLVALGGSFAMAAVRMVNPAANTLAVWGDAAGATVPVGVSASSMGWTVTVDSVMSDRWYFILRCTLSKDNGTAIVPGEYGFGAWDFGLYPLSNSGGIAWLTDEDPGDNRIPFGFSVRNDNEYDFAGRTLHLTLTNLVSADFWESWGMMLAGGGRWELDIPLHAESKAVEYTPKLVFQVLDKAAAIRTLWVSPLEVWVELTSAEGAFFLYNGTREDYDETLARANAFTLLLADGTRLQGSGGGGSGDGNELYGAYGREDRAPIRAEDVVAFQVGDGVYPLSLE